MRGAGFAAKGNLVVADNVVTPGAPQYRAYVRQNPRFESWGVKGLIIPGDLEVDTFFLSSYISTADCYAGRVGDQQGEIKSDGLNT